MDVQSVVGGPLRVVDALCLLGQNCFDVNTKTLFAFCFLCLITTLWSLENSSGNKHLCTQKSDVQRFHTLDMPDIQYQIIFLTLLKEIRQGIIHLTLLESISN
jgi:hypothetical protein